MYTYKQEKLLPVGVHEIKKDAGTAKKKPPPTPLENSRISTTKTALVSLLLTKMRISHS